MRVFCLAFILTSVFRIRYSVFILRRLGERSSLGAKKPTRLVVEPRRRYSIFNRPRRRGATGPCGAESWHACVASCCRFCDGHVRFSSLPSEHSHCSAKFEEIPNHFVIFETGRDSNSPRAARQPRELTGQSLFQTGHSAIMAARQHAGRSPAAIRFLF